MNTALSICRFIHARKTNTLSPEPNHSRRHAMTTPAPIALITGGSRGLGRNAALKLAARGTDIVLTYRSNRAEAETVVGAIEKLGRRAVALPLDVGRVAGFDAFANALRTQLRDRWQREHFDFLVNNAGIGAHASFAETSEAQFDELMNVQFKGVFFLTQKLLPLIADGGRILNISSGLARFSLPGYAAYASMKGAIEVLTRYLAKELGPRGIAVNVLAPGAIETDFGGGAVRDNKELNRFVASNTALGRVGLPDDIGDVVASLLAPESRWINAQRIEASGGMFL
jgi:NAD(P)-dependent dehydrogenase (short-subunit alcohol dehydrogenase family)